MSEVTKEEKSEGVREEGESFQRVSLPLHPYILTISLYAQKSPAFLPSFLPSCRPFLPSFLFHPTILPLPYFLPSTQSCPLLNLRIYAFYPTFFVINHPHGSIPCKQNTHTYVSSTRHSSALAHDRDMCVCYTCMCVCVCVYVCVCYTCIHTHVYISVCKCA